MSRQLPPQPQLDVLRKQARQLHRDHAAGEPDAVARVRSALRQLPPSASECFTLRHAQQVLAHEYGFTSWQALRSRVEPADADEVVWSDRHRHYETLVDDLVTAVRDERDERFGPPGRRLRAALAGMQERPGEQEILAAAQSVVAQANGCASWRALHQKVVEPVAAQLDRAQLIAFHDLHAELGRLLAEERNAEVGEGRRIELDNAYADQTSFGEFLLSMAPGAQVVRLSAEALGGHPALGLGRALLDGPFLDDGDRGQRASSWAQRVARALQTALAPVAAGRIDVVTLYPEPFDALAQAPMYEIGALCALEVRRERQAGGPSALLELFYPANGLVGALEAGTGPVSSRDG